MTAPLATNSPSTDAAQRPHGEVTDSRDRVYRIGETDRDILGHSRNLVIHCPGSP